MLLSDLTFALSGLILGSVPLPGTSSVTVPLSTPAACLRCHGGFDISGSAGETWSGSAMAHAARDPLFRAAVVEAEKDHPGVGDLCFRCHAPRAWLEGRCFPTDGSGLEMTDRGIGCSACHRMEPNPWVRNGQYIVANDSTMRGPYGDSNAPHHKARSDWISDSRLCGTCHDLFVPGVFRRTLTGTLTPYLFPEQTTYLEWAASAYAEEGESCMDCHMREEMGPIAKNEAPRPDRSNHGLAGGNLFLLEAIEFLEPQLGLSTELALGRARIMAVLQSAATMEQRMMATVGRGDLAQVVLRVTNESGHKLPTGYPEGRRVWLEVSIPGLGVEAGTFDAMTGEPIDAPVVYHAVHGQAGIGPGHHLALNDTIFEDTRIPPRGFVPTATTAPVGKTYPIGADGKMVHWDDVTVTATVPCDAGDSYAGTARLWYQSVTKRYVDTLVAAAGADPAGARLEGAFAAVDPQPVELVSADITVTVTPGSTCAPPDAGVWPDAVVDAGFADDAMVAAADAGVRVPDAGTNMPDDDDCSCTSTRRRGSGAGSFFALVLAAVMLRRRDQRGSSAMKSSPK